MTERVLVVDDDATMRSICLRVLGAMGLEAEAAASREEAWSVLAGREFELVLTDLHMAHSDDGVALTEEIKSRCPSTDVVLMTGQPSVQSAVAAMKGGAIDYLLKPFAPDQLEQVIGRCFERRRLSADLARERAMRAELESAYAELQKLERLKDAFLGRVNHELRTPVAVAMLASEAMESAPPQAWPPLRRKLDAALAGLKGTVEELLLFSRLTKGDLTPALGELDLAVLLNEACLELMEKAKDRGVALRCQAPGAPCPLRADAELLRTAFRHLLDNAVRFNKRGGEVSVALSRPAGGLEIVVRDTGIGIPEAQVGSLFDSFYQVADHLTREAGGLGLGLATVRRIVEAHGGRVTVESRVDRGSAFTVWLPSDKR